MLTLSSPSCTAAGLGDWKRAPGPDITETPPASAAPQHMYDSSEQSNVSPRTVILVFTRACLLRDCGIVFRVGA